jgi:hypothetical protein
LLIFSASIAAERLSACFALFKLSSGKAHETLVLGSMTAFVAMHRPTGIERNVFSICRGRHF